MSSAKEPHSVEETSSGHVKSSSGWLDLHFKAAQEEYLGMLLSIGIQSSWHVLDAGCGAGQFLPFIADLVGSQGSIHAIDIAEEHIITVKNMVEAGSFQCPVKAEVSSTTSLAYEDNTFNAVWCANVSEYLTDKELSDSIEGFCRVVKPGGLIAIKEFDGRSMTFYPSDPRILLRFISSRYSATPSIQGQYRAISIKFRMEERGLINVRQRTILIERSQPLRSIERAFLSDLFAGWSVIANELDLPAEDKKFWQQQENSEDPTHIINQADFFWREGAILTVGEMPMK